MKKKLLSLLMCTFMLGTLVTGCGNDKPPTPQELLEKAWGSEEVTSVDIGIELELGADVDMSELTGEDVSMSFSVDTNLDLKAKEGLAYIDGTAGANILGMTMDIPIKSYLVTDEDGNVSYTYSDEDKCWYIEEGGTDSSIDTESITNLNASIFDNLTMDEVTKESNVYTLRGLVDYASIAEKLGVDMNELLKDVNTQNINLDEFTFNTVMIFDKETKLIKSMELFIDTDSIKVENNVKFSTFNVKIIVNQINGVSIEIPDDVINSAIEKSSSSDTDFIYEDTETSIDSTNYNLETEDDVSETGVEDIVSEIETEDNNIDLNSSSSLSKYVLGVDYAYEDDILEVLKLYYSTMPSDDVVWSFLNFFNNYTAEELCEYMDLYDYWELDDKIALGILVDMGAMDLSSLQVYGVDIVEMESIINSHVEVLK